MGRGVLYKPSGEEMGQVSMLSSVALSFFPRAKTQKSGRAAEGRPALGPLRTGNLLTSLAGERHLQGGAILEPQFHPLSCQETLVGR